MLLADPNGYYGKRYSNIGHTMILSREGAMPRVSGFFFKAVVQSVFLCSAETWVVTHRMGRFLGRFRD